MTSMPSRRTFLGLAGAGTLAAAAGGTPLFAAERAGQGYAPVTDKWDMTWVERVKGRHRGVFDSPELAGGMALFRAVMWQDQMKEVYGVERPDASAVLVLRHTAIPLVMNDEFWSRFAIGRAMKVKGPHGRWATANPIRVSPPGTPAKWASYNLESFVAGGGTVLGCGVAFEEIAARFVQRDKLSPEDAAKAAREHMLPGVVLQPSGVFAVMAAQEAGCNYILAS
ncbi:MAG: hypothetical protein JWM27_1587 [Gemmatimonadetes bacterium]|nr:hypothetical protein [Gemmatimonadota bacterium]